MEINVNANGANVFWTLGEDTDADLLEKQLSALRTSFGALAPKKNSDKAALHIATKKVCANRRRLVRPLPSGIHGYSVVNEEPDDNGKSLDHSVDFNVLFLQGGDNTPVFQDPQTGEIIFPKEANEVLAKYAVERQRCNSHKVGIMLARIVDRLHGVSLRPTGGYYWLPEPKIKLMEAVAQIIRDASPGGRNTIYFMRTVLDENGKVAVIDGLVRQLTSELESIEAQVEEVNEEGKRAMKKRGLKTKQERCERLHNRVRGYEKMFQTKLDSLRETVERVEEATTFAALEAMDAAK